MPFVRDAKTSAASVNSTSFTMAQPQHETDDLLFAWVVRDGQSGSIPTPSGWTLAGVTDRTFSVFISGFYKIATSSSEADLVITSTASETWCGVIVAVGEVDTSDPIEAEDDVQGSTNFTATPQLTTANNDCLVLHFIASDSQAGPSLKPGCGFINSFNGISESFGAFWTYQPSAGTTSQYDWYHERDVNHTAYSVAVNGDTSNAPAHIDSGSPPATVLHPLIGTKTTTGFGGTFTNNASSIASQVDGIDLVAAFNFGTTVDAGVNSVHEGLLVRADAAQVGDIASGYVRLDSAVDLTGKTIAIHAFADSQYDVNTTAGTDKRGVVFAVADTSGNWKAWVVAASDSEPTDTNQIPILINPEDDINVIDSSGTLVLTAIRDFIFGVSSPAGDSRHNFSQLQILDDLIVVGGSSARPITLKDVVDLSFGSFNRTGQRQGGQGTTQALLFAPLQIGNGTDTTYFEESAASLEFGRQSSLTDRRLQYNVAAGFAGVRFYAVSGDTIKFTNSIISSATRYFFEIHASSTSAAAWDFNGLQVIGAGPITLNDVGQLGGISFSQGSVVTLNDCDLSGGCTFFNMDSPVVTVTSQAQLDQLANCTFTDNNIHIRVDVAGSISLNFDNITFNGGLFDIDYTGTGTLTANMLNGSNAASASTSGGGTVVIVNSKTLTLTGLENPTEVRVFDNANPTTEVAGQEAVTTGTYSVAIDSGAYPSVIIHIMALGYENIRLTSISMASDTTIPISQQVDRQYANP